MWKEDFGGDKLPDKVIVVGGGLAGSEAAWQLARRGIKVELWEMRPEKLTPAHRTGYLAELVCSNSLRSDSLENAAGILKEEMRLANSLIMKVAEECKVPAGKALAVDRERFAFQITSIIESNPLITVIREEVCRIPQEDIVIIATGPLTSDALSQELESLIGESYLYFYDAAAPIVTTESLDHNRIFKASRYNRGEADYLNCPLNEEEYQRFYQALIEAKRHPRHEFEPEVIFEGCMPIEVMAKRGPSTLLFGPMRPVGLVDPRTGKEPYAVVQLRRDNLEGTLYNLVGFQTNLRWREQERVFRLIPGLEKAEFVRFGVMHRNTYINSPQLLKRTLQLKDYPHILLAGQLTGVEGYIESAASGLIAGINAARLYYGKEPLEIPDTTAHGSLIKYITDNVPHDIFQPMHVNFGLFPSLERRIKVRRKRNLAIAKRALNDWTNIDEFSDN
ncbi:MAG: methylenetetrahydrofolate--tRNA-(uracil-5-)-methyltransferase [Clostridia bacterium]|nr:methylenetetrahydrofolate--tRNA-(uracil-5-)-methyltransferase [Clostridia bacterium]